MTLDIDIAIYAKNRKMRVGQPKPPPMFERTPVGFTPLSRTTPLDKLAKRMRYTAHRRHEAQSKQVQFLINQRQFAQNQTWKFEYDRLRGSDALNVQEQLLIDARINDLLKEGLQIK